MQIQSCGRRGSVDGESGECAQSIIHDGSKKNMTRAWMSCCGCCMSRVGYKEEILIGKIQKKASKTTESFATCSFFGGD